MTYSKKEELEAQRKHEANTAHRAKIHRALRVWLSIELELDDAKAREIVEAMSEGKIPNVKMDY